MKRITNKFLIALAFALAIAFSQAPPAQAQTGGASITGQVKDPQGANVPGATVTLYTRERAASYTTTTDSSGNYRFERLAAGEYLVTAEAPNFATSSGQSVTVERGQQSTLDISLDLAGIRNTVVVTASNTPQPIDEVSKAITVVDQHEIDDRDEATIAESLRTVPGLRVQQLGGPGSFTSIKTRGLRSEDTAVLIDGFRFRDAAAPAGDASGYLQDLVVTDLSRVEVLRGSGSSLYGSNAIGGVINIVTDEGGGPLHGSFLAEGGGLQMFRARGQLAGGFHDDRIIFSAGFSELNLFSGIDGHDESRNTSGQGRILFRLSPTTQLSARIYASNSQSALNNSPVAIGVVPATGIIDARPLSLSEKRRYEAGTPIGGLSIGNATFIADAHDPDNLRKANFFSGAVAFSQRLTEAFGYTVSYQGVATNRQSINGPSGVDFQPFGGTEQLAYNARVHTINARFDARLGRAHLITGGYEFESENFKNPVIEPDPADNSNVDVTQKSHAFFIQDQIRLLDGRLQFSAAFRTQLFRLDQPRFTPATASPYAGLTFLSPPTAYTGDGSVAYFFRSTNTKLRAHVGNSYRAPSLYERFGTFYSGFFGYSTYGDPRLRPDRAVAGDAGIDQSFVNNKLRISATYFYTRLQQVIAFDFSGLINPATDPFGRFGGYLNTNGGIARGGELSMTASPTRSLNLFAAYTYTKAQQRTQQVPGTRRALVIPIHQFSLVTTQRIGQRWLVNFDLAASSDYIAPVFNPVTFSSRGYRFKGIAKADAGLSYTMSFGEKRSLRLFGYLDNLFGRGYFESGFATPGRIGRAGAAFSF